MHEGARLEGLAGKGQGPARGGETEEGIEKGSKRDEKTTTRWKSMHPCSVSKAMVWPDTGRETRRGERACCTASRRRRTPLP